MEMASLTGMALSTAVTSISGNQRFTLIEMLQLLQADTITKEEMRTWYESELKTRSN